MGRNLKPIFSRLVLFFLSIFILHSVSFLLLKAFPGSPLSGESNLNSAVLELLEEQYGLNQPWYTQYFHHLSALTRGSLGVSLHSGGKEVSTIISETLPVTFRLAGGAWLVSLTASLLLASLFVLKIKNPKAYVLTTVSLISFPSLFIAPLLLWIFAYKLEWFPVALLGSWRAWVLPILVLSIRPTVSLLRILKTQMESVLQEDYVRTARAFALPQKYILKNVIVKNSLIPYLSHLVPLTAGLFAGNVIVETLFGVPGVGHRFVQALQENDIALITGLITFFGALLMFAQLTVDLLIRRLDPRQRIL